MRAKKAGRLTKRDYYSPVAIIAADIKGLITDFNVFAQVLFMPFVEGAKNKPLVDFLDNVCPGCGLRSVLASAVDPSGEVMAAKRSANRKDDPKKLIRTLDAQYHSSRFGLVGLHLTVLDHLDINSGEFTETTLYCVPVKIESQSLFQKKLEDEWENRIDWEVYAVSYDRVLPIMPFYQEVVSRHIDAMSAPGVLDVLDVGAGTGNVALPLLQAGRRVAAVDRSRAMIEKLSVRFSGDELGKLMVVEQNAESLPQFTDESFDAVNILLALWDMNRPERALAECNRLLRKGGTFIITEPKRSFNRKHLYDFALKYLKERGLYQSLSEDMERIMNVNDRRDPTLTQSTDLKSGRLFVEDIQEWLSENGFEVCRVEDSHFGNCATLWATKADSHNQAKS